MNGIYYFQDVDFNITGGIVSNTSDGVPHYGPYGGVSDLPAAADRTNGVTFVFDGNAKFTASTSGNTSPSVFFAAPSFISSGTDSIAFFIKATDTISGPNGSPWDEEIDGTKGTAGGYPFQVWGSVFNADNNGSHGTVVTLRAVSASNGTNRYAVTGEVVSPQVDLDGGNMVTGPYTPNAPAPPPAPQPEAIEQTQYIEPVTSDGFVVCRDNRHEVETERVSQERSSPILTLTGRYFDHRSRHDFTLADSRGSA